MSDTGYLVPPARKRSQPGVDSDNRVWELKPSGGGFRGRKLVGAAVEIVAAPDSEIPRLLASVKLAVERSVPPANRILPGVGAPGAAPSAASAAIEIAPALIVVAPL